MKLTKLLVLSCVLVGGGCTPQEYRSLSIGEPKLVTDFNYQPTPEEIKDFACDEIGINAVKVLDSLLIVGHGGCWTIINRNSGSKTNILGVGQGPEEFYSIPRCSSAYYHTVNDSLYALIPDATKGRIMRINITGATSGRATKTEPYIENPVLTNDLWDVIVCDSTTFWMSVPNESFTGFSRMIWDSDSIYEPEVTKEISSHTVSDNINLLSRVTRYNKGAFVEAMVYLNQINVYSLTGDKGETICVGNRLDNVNEVEKTARPDLRNTYNSVAVWDCGFGAVYSGRSDKEILLRQGNESEIQFFRWDGSPVYRIKFPFEIVSFDLDTTQQTIYVIDADKDVLRKYDAKAIVASFGSESVGE